MFFYKLLPSHSIKEVRSLGQLDMYEQKEYITLKYIWLKLISIYTYVQQKSIILLK